MGLIEYRKFDEYLREFLSLYVGKQFGLGRIPAQDDIRDELAPLSELTIPYGVIYPMNSPRGTGSWAQPEEDRDLLYQITLVGVDALQVRWISDKTRSVLLERAASGYSFPMVITGMEVTSRVSDAIGAILPSGVDLYNAHDNYRICVGV